MLDGFLAKISSSDENNFLLTKEYDFLLLGRSSSRDSFTVKINCGSAHGSLDRFGLSAVTSFSCRIY